MVQRCFCLFFNLLDDKRNESINLIKHSNRRLLCNQLDRKRQQLVSLEVFCGWKWGCATGANNNQSCDKKESFILKPDIHNKVDLEPG